MSSEPKQVWGWITAEQFNRLRIEPSVSYRVAKRVDGPQVWYAPLGTEDFWPLEESDQWLDMVVTKQ